MSLIGRSLVRDRVMRLYFLGSLVLALPYFVPLLTPSALEFYGGTVSELILLSGALAVFLSRRHASVDAAERRFLGFIALAQGLWLTQKTVRWLELVPVTVASAFAEDCLLVGFYLALAVAVLLGPEVGVRAPRFGPRRVVDLLGTVVFALGLLAYFSGVPLVKNPELYLSNLPSMALLCSLDLLLMLRLAWALRHARAGRGRAVFGCLLVTSILWFVTDFAETLLYAGVLPALPSGTPWDFVWWLPFLTLVAAGRLGDPALHLGTDPSMVPPATDHSAAESSLSDG
ncbi:MAG TPA: hypothetical protein VIZ31_07750, partial [Vicinamibacteria bacterium]